MIMIAVEYNNSVSVYNDNKTLLFNKKGILYNYSDNYVAIKRVDSSDIIDIFDCKGELVGSYPNDFVDTSNIAGIVL